jgi:hypothetical protein
MRFSALRPTSIVTLGVLVLLPACVTKPVQPTATAQAPQPVVAPTMTIERFMRAVNQNDLNTMARLFGTRDGPINRAWPAKEVDERMRLLATVLRHNDYAIGQEDIVPGRRSEATQFTVNVTVGQRVVPVPFVLVRSAQAPEWLIENIAIDRLTRGGA